jgi:acetoin utilization deacetylase AcuC-like enzyme
MASRISALARDICSGRLVALQEGGYSLDHLPYCTLAIVEALAGLQPTLKGDPLEMDVPTRLHNSEADAVRLAREIHARHWTL